MLTFGVFFVTLLTIGSGIAAKDWWEHATIYQIYPRSFMDSDGDGVGDFKGITSKLDHLVDIGVDTIWMSPMFQSALVDFGYDVSDFYQVHSEYGTMADFDELLAKVKELGLKILLDFVPNHTSDEHAWFVASANNEEKYRNYYIWHDGDGSGGLPNNWVSVFGGPAWTWHEGRQQYYLHQFSAGQPDLNYRNSEVVAEMTKVLTFWLNKGASGFRLDAINHMFENEDFLNEPVNEWATPGTYDYTDHIYTKDLPEGYEVVALWKDALTEYVKTYGGDTRILITEAYASTDNTMKYYFSANMPFNFQLIYLENNSDSHRYKSLIGHMLDYMPSGKNPNWVIGSHDHSRVASKMGSNMVDVLNTIVLTLPGTSFTYYGEEIGMIDYPNLHIYDERDKNRTPMQWDATVSAGFSTNQSTWLPVVPEYISKNVAQQKASTEKTHYSHYKELTQLRKQATFIQGDFNLKIINYDVFAYTRELNDHDTHIVVVNVRGQEQTVNLLAHFVNLPESLNVKVSSPGSRYANKEDVAANNITLEPFASVVFYSSGSVALGGSIMLFVMLLLTFIVY